MNDAAWVGLTSIASLAVISAIWLSAWLRQWRCARDLAFELSLAVSRTDAAVGRNARARALLEAEEASHRATATRLDALLKADSVRQTQLAALRRERDDAKECLRATGDSRDRAEGECNRLRDLLARADRDHAELSGQLQDALHREGLWLKHLDGCETAQAIADDDETKARNNQ